MRALEVQGKLNIAALIGPMAALLRRLRADSRFRRLPKRLPMLPMLRAAVRIKTGIWRSGEALTV